MNVSKINKLHLLRIVQCTEKKLVAKTIFQFPQFFGLAFGRKSSDIWTEKKQNMVSLKFGTTLNFLTALMTIILFLKKKTVVKQKLVNRTKKGKTSQVSKSNKAKKNNHQI